MFAAVVCRSTPWASREAPFDRRPAASATRTRQVCREDHAGCSCCACMATLPHSGCPACVRAPGAGAWCAACLLGCMRLLTPLIGHHRSCKALYGLHAVCARLSPATQCRHPAADCTHERESAPAGGGSGDDMSYHPHSEAGAHMHSAAAAAESLAGVATAPPCLQCTELSRGNRRSNQRVGIAAGTWIWPALRQAQCHQSIPPHVPCENTALFSLPDGGSRS